jgi:hypothetical protein
MAGSKPLPLYSLRSAEVGVTSPDGHTSFSTQTGSAVQLWGLKTELVRFRPSSYRGGHGVRLQDGIDAHQ